MIRLPASALALHRPGISRRRLLAGLGACAGLVAPLRSAMAQDIRFFRIGTGTTGGTYFPIGGIIASAISGPPGAPPCELGGSCGVPGLIAVAQASQGSVENIENMRSGGIESALTQADVAYHAFSGTGVFRDSGPFLALRGIARLYVEEVHVVVPAGMPVASVADLRGVRVALGEQRSGTLVGARLVLSAHGLSETDLEPHYIGPEPAADMIDAGRLDALFFIGGAPMLAVSDLARRIPIRLLAIDGEPAARLLAEQPFFAETTIAGDIYEDVPEVKTVGVGALFVVSEHIDEETVYGITRGLWHPSTKTLLANGHPRGARIAMESALQGLAVPIHPGALRYYGEVGLLGSPETDLWLDPDRYRRREIDAASPAAGGAARSNDGG